MEPVEARFRAAIELRELMIAMQRQILAREHPDEPEDKLERRLREWVVLSHPLRHQEPASRP